MQGRPRPTQLLNCLWVETSGTGDLFCVCLRPSVKPQFRLSTKPETWGPKPDQTPPLRPAKADTFGVTSEEAAMGTALRLSRQGPVSYRQGWRPRPVLLSHLGVKVLWEPGFCVGPGRLDTFLETLGCDLLPTPLAKGLGRKGGAGSGGGGRRKRRQRIPESYNQLTERVYVFLFETRAGAGGRVSGCR